MGVSIAVLAYATCSSAQQPMCQPTLSAFWRMRTALCDRVQVLRSTIQNVPDGSVSVLDSSGWQDLCQTTRPPAIASLSDTVRIAQLDELAKREGANPDGLPRAAQAAEGDLGVMSSALADEVGDPDRNFALGGAASLLTEKFRALGCDAADSATEAWLSFTCKGAVSGGLPALRQKLALDVLALPSRVLARTQLPATEGQKLRLVSALFQALAQSPTTFAAAQALDPSGTCGGSRAATPALPSPIYSGDPLALMGRLWLRVLIDVEGARQTDDFYVLALQQVLVDSQRLVPGVPLSPGRQQAAMSLVRDLRQARQDELLLSRTDSTTLPALVARITSSLVDALAQSWVLAVDEVWPYADAMRTAESIVHDLLIGDTFAAMELALAELPADQVPERTRRIARVGARLAISRTETEAARALAALIAPEWLTGLIFDARASIPIVNMRAFNIDLAGTAGWEAKRWGFWVSGRRAVYDAQTSQRDITEAQATAAGRAWFNLGEVGSPFGVSLGAEFGFDQVASDLTLLDATAITSDEVSQIVRGNLSAGAWLRPHPDFVARFSGAAGLHREFYNRDVVIPSGPDAGYTSTDIASSSGDYRGQALIGYRVWPDILRASLQGDVSYYQVTRSSDFFSYTFSDQLSAHSTVVHATRVEAHAQFVLEIEALALYKVQPGAFAEIEYVRTDDGKAPLSVTVPQVGLQLRSHLPD